MDGIIKIFFQLFQGLKREKKKKKDSLSSVLKRREAVSEAIFEQVGHSLQSFFKENFSALFKKSIRGKVDDSPLYHSSSRRNTLWKFVRLFEILKYSDKRHRGK